MTVIYSYVQSIKQKIEHLMIFHHQIAAETCDKYYLTDNSVYFPNMNAVLEIEVLHALKIVLILDF